MKKMFSTGFNNLEFATSLKKEKGITNLLTREDLSAQMSIYEAVDKAAKQYQKDMLEKVLSENLIKMSCRRELWEITFDKSLSSDSTGVICLEYNSERVCFDECSDWSGIILHVRPVDSFVEHRDWKQITISPGDSEHIKLMYHYPRGCEHEAGNASIDTIVSNDDGQLRIRRAVEN